MRISVDDPLAPFAKVYLDGIRLKNCTEADEESGIVTVYKLNSSGDIYLLPGSDCIATEQLHGIVKIEMDSKYL
mgnify:CR=1 FL=1